MWYAVKYVCCSADVLWCSAVSNRCSVVPQSAGIVPQLSNIVPYLSSYQTMLVLQLWTKLPLLAPGQVPLLLCHRNLFCQHHLVPDNVPDLSGIVQILLTLC